MRIAAFLIFIVMAPLADAAQNKYLCEIHKGAEDSAGKQTLEPSIGQAAVIDDGDKFFIYVNDRIQLQSPKLKKTKHTLLSVSKDGYQYVKGDGYYFVGHGDGGFLFDDCEIQE